MVSLDSCMWNITWQHSNLRFKIGEDLYLAYFTEQTKDYIGDGFFILGYHAVYGVAHWLNDQPHQKSTCIFFDGIKLPDN